MNVSEKAELARRVSDAVSEARLAAHEAALEFQREYGSDLMPCGFAWVNVTVDGRSPLAKQLKKHGFRKSHVSKTLQLWCSLQTQSIDLKEYWARAFACKLKEHGIDAYPGSRLD